jgi:hypothetical protein
VGGGSHLLEEDTSPLMRPTFPNPFSAQKAPTSSRNVSRASSGSPTCTQASATVQVPRATAVGSAVAPLQPCWYPRQQLSCREQHLRDGVAVGVWQNGDGQLPRRFVTEAKVHAIQLAIVQGYNVCVLHTPDD